MRRNRGIKAGPTTPIDGHAKAFATIVDLARFTAMVSTVEQHGELIAQFTRDGLYKAVFFDLASRLLVAPSPEQDFSGSY